MDIDEKIIEKVTKCEKLFACLSNNKHKYCKISACVDDEICFINDNEMKTCNYMEGYFGSVKRCTCPVRIAIYNKNKN
jgi:hypothetical protein